MSYEGRARLFGSIVVVLGLVAGVATGVAIGRRPSPGVNVVVRATTTDAIPHELERLGLSDRR